MSVETKTVASLKGQLSKFSGIISKGFNKAKQRLMEMLYGIQASKDVKLSNIARTFKEDQPLIKTEDKLSRNLDDEDFTDPMNREIVRLAASKVTEDMVIAIDPGDLRKRYAKRMEFLGRSMDIFFARRWPQIWSIRNIVVLVLAVSYFASVYLGQSIKLKMLVKRIFLVSKRFFGVPSFFNYAIADGIYNLLFPDKTALRGVKQTDLDDFQLCFDFG